MKEVILLGYKSNENGGLFLYNTEIKQGHKVSLGDTINFLLDPYPYAQFTTLDTELDIFKENTPCFIKANADITDEEFNNMNTTGIMYHRFKDRDIQIISEFTQPMKYAWEMYQSKYKSLGEYQIVNKISHRFVNSELELDYLKKLIEFSFKKYSKTNYNIDTLMDSNTIKLSEFFFLMQEKYNVRFTFENSYKDKDMLKSINLNIDYLKALIGLGYSHFDWLLLNKNITNELLDNLSKEEIYKVFRYLDSRDLNKLDHLNLRTYLSRTIEYNIEHVLPNKTYQTSNGKIYEDIFDLYSDNNYKTIDTSVEYYDGFLPSTENLLSEAIEDIILSYDFIPYVSRTTFPIFRQLNLNILKQTDEMSYDKIKVFTIK